MEIDSKKIFVGGLSWNTSSEALKTYFSQYGEVTDSVIMMDNVTKKPRGFGFVTFADPSSVDLALASDQHHMLDEKKIDPKRAVNQGAGKVGAHSTSVPTEKVKKVFVGGIPAGAQEEEVRTYFANFGTVTDVELKFDKATQRMRGFGFVTFESEDDVEKLCAEQFVSFKDKRVEVKKAEPRYQGGGGMGQSGGSYGGSKSYTQGFQSGYPRGGGGGSGSGGSQYGYGYGYGQAGGFGQSAYGQGGYNQGYGYTTGGYSQGFPQAPSYGQGSFNQQGAGYGYTTTQNYAYPQNYDTSAARPGQQQVSGGAYQQESNMYGQGSVARGGFPSGTEQYGSHSGGSYGAGYGTGSDMSSSGSSYQPYVQGNGEKQSGGFTGGARGGQQTHPSVQYSAGFGAGR